MEIKKLLEEEVRNKFKELETMNVGSEEYEAAVTSLSKLTDRLIEVEKLESENEVALKTMEDEKNDRRVRNGIAIGGIVIPAALTVWGTIKSLKFEEEGTVTTVMGRGFLNKLLPKK